MTNKNDDNERKGFCNTGFYLFKEAVKQVPILRYSWVIIAAIGILSLVGYFKLKSSEVFIYAILILLISVLAFICSYISRSKDKAMKWAVNILAYGIVTVICALMLGFASFIFLGKPDFYIRWFPEISKNVPANTQDSILVSPIDTTKKPSTSDSPGRIQIIHTHEITNEQVPPPVIPEVTPNEEIKSLVEDARNYMENSPSNALDCFTKAYNKLSDEHKMNKNTLQEINDKGLSVKIKLYDQFFQKLNY